MAGKNGVKFTVHLCTDCIETVKKAQGWVQKEKFFSGSTDVIVWKTDSPVLKLLLE